MFHSPVLRCPSGVVRTLRSSYCCRGIRIWISIQYAVCLSWGSPVQLTLPPPPPPPLVINKLSLTNGISPPVIKSLCVIVASDYFPPKCGWWLLSDCCILCLIRNSPVLFSLRCHLRKAHMLVSQKFSKCCLSNSSSVRVIDDVSF